MKAVAPIKQDEKVASKPDVLNEGAKKRGAKAGPQGYEEGAAALAPGNQPGYEAQKAALEPGNQPGYLGAPQSADAGLGSALGSKEAPGTKDGETDQLSKEGAAARLEKSPVELPIKWNRALENPIFGSLGANLDLTLRANKNDWIDGGVKVEAKGGPSTCHINYDFDKGTVGGGFYFYGNGVSIDPDGKGGMIIRPKIDPMNVILGPVTQEVALMTKGIITPTFTGSVGGTIVVPKEGEPYLQAMNGNVGVAISVDFAAAATHVSNEAEALGSELGESVSGPAPVPAPTEPVFGRDGIDDEFYEAIDQVADEAKRSELKGGEQVSWAGEGYDVTLSTASPGLKFILGGNWSINSTYRDLETGADSLDVHAAKIVGFVEVQIGTFKVKLGVSDEGKAVGSPAERRALAKQAFEAALVDAFDAIPKSEPETEKEMKAWARRVNGVFSNRWASNVEDIESMIYEMDPDAKSHSISSHFIFPHGSGLYETSGHSVVLKGHKHLEDAIQGNPVLLEANNRLLVQREAPELSISQAEKDDLLRIQNALHSGETERVVRLVDEYYDRYPDSPVLKMIQEGRERQE